jgi:hypothetical protein
MRPLVLCLIILLSFLLWVSPAAAQEPLYDSARLNGQVQADNSVRYALVLPPNQSADGFLLTLTVPPDVIVAEMQQNGQIKAQSIVLEATSQRLTWSVAAFDELLRPFVFTTSAPLSNAVAVEVQSGDAITRFSLFPYTVDAAQAEASITVDEPVTANTFLPVGSTGVMVTSPDGIAAGTTLTVRELPPEQNPDPSLGDFWWCSQLSLEGAAGLTVYVPLRRPLPANLPLSVFGQNADGTWQRLEIGAYVSADGLYAVYTHPGGVVATGTEPAQNSESVPPPAPPADSDADGIPDPSDSCPQQGSIGFGLDASGCPLPPPPDSDGDGLIDPNDACPQQGDAGFGLDASGCPLPPPDSDGDGLIDPNDACPQQGDAGFGLDAGGCPIPPPADSDGDGILDVDDACPQAGAGNHGLGSDGCPLPLPTPTIDIPTETPTETAAAANIPNMVSLTLDKTSAVAGDVITAALTFDAPAPTGGVPLIYRVSGGYQLVEAPDLAEGANSVTIRLQVSDRQFTDSTEFLEVSSGVPSSGLSILSQTFVVRGVTITELALPLTVRGLPAEIPGSVSISEPRPVPVTIALGIGSRRSVSPYNAPTVTIPAGETRGTFVLTASGADATGEPFVEIIARPAGANAFTVRHMTLIAPVLDPQFTGPQGSILAGAYSLSIVNSGTTVYTLTSSHPDIISMPAEISTFGRNVRQDITVRAPQAPQTVTITLSTDGGAISRSITFTVLNTVISALEAPPTVTGGVQYTARVTLANAAPDGGTVLNVTSSAGFFTGVPGSITVPAGATTAEIPFTPAAGVTAVNSNLSLFVQPAGTCSTVSGCGGRSVRINILPVPHLSGVSLSGTTVAPGQPVTANITLSSPATSNTTVQLAPLDQRAFALVFPPQVVIPTGSSTAQFTIGTNQNQPLSNVGVELTIFGVPTRLQAVVNVSAITISAVSTAPTEIRAGESTTLTVTLAEPAPAGGVSTVVTLTSPTGEALGYFNSSTLQVLIRPGEREGRVTLQSLNPPRNVIRFAPRFDITANAVFSAGVITNAVSASFSIVPVGVPRFVNAEQTLEFGTSFTPSLSLIADFGSSATPTRFKLSSSDPVILAIPESVEIPAGQAFISVPMTLASTWNVPESERVVRVTATSEDGFHSSTATIRVTDTRIETLEVSPSSASGLTTVNVAIKTNRNPGRALPVQIVCVSPCSLRTQNGEFSFSATTAPDGTLTIPAFRPLAIGVFAGATPPALTSNIRVTVSDSSIERPVTILPAYQYDMSIPANASSPLLPLSLSVKPLESSSIAHSFSVTVASSNPSVITGGWVACSTRTAQTQITRLGTTEGCLRVNPVTQPTPVQITVLMNVIGETSVLATRTVTVTVMPSVASTPTLSPVPTITSTPTRTAAPTSTATPRPTLTPIPTTFSGTVSLVVNTTASGGTFTGTVRLSSPARGNVTVTLSSSNRNLVSVPVSITIPSGQQSANFTYRVTPTLPLTTSGVAITATVSGVSTTVRVMLQ